MIKKISCYFALGGVWTQFSGTASLRATNWATLAGIFVILFCFSLFFVCLFLFFFFFSLFLAFFLYSFLVELYVYFFFLFSFLILSFFLRWIGSSIVFVLTNQIQGDYFDNKTADYYQTEAIFLNFGGLLTLRIQIKMTPPCQQNLFNVKTIYQQHNYSLLIQFYTFSHFYWFNYWYILKFCSNIDSKSSNNTFLNIIEILFLLLFFYFLCK